MIYGKVRADPSTVVYHSNAFSTVGKFWFSVLHFFWCVFFSVAGSDDSDGFLSAWFCSSNCVFCLVSLVWVFDLMLCQAVAMRVRVAVVAWQAVCWLCAVESALQGPTEQWSGRVPSTWAETGHCFQTECDPRCFQATLGYRDNIKSCSCLLSCLKPRHALVEPWCPAAASSSLVPRPFILHACLCLHTCVCAPGRNAWALAACGTGILTYFPFRWNRRWKSFEKWIVPLNFKSLKMALYWEFNSFLNVNSGKYLLSKREYPSAFSHHWKLYYSFQSIEFQGSLMLKVSAVAIVRRCKVLCLWLEYLLASFPVWYLPKFFQIHITHKYSGAFRRVKGN